MIKLHSASATPDTLNGEGVTAAGGGDVDSALPERCVLTLTSDRTLSATLAEDGRQLLRVDSEAFVSVNSDG